MWTEEKIKLLTDLWHLKLSGTKIGERLGMTRNAVLGKISRLGLMGEGPPPQPPPLRKASPAPRRRPRVRSDGALPAPTVPLPPSPDAATRSFAGLYGPSYDLIDLGLWDCKFPIGDPSEPNFCFCAARKPNPFKPYCVHHMNIAHQRV